MSILLMVGCAPESIDATYGRRRGEKGTASVNGTAVFAEMFERRGYRVRSINRLSPAIESAKVLVWFPDDFDVPAVKVVQFLENWLMQASGRTLIYVGRDYDATVTYWKRMLSASLPESRFEIRRRLATAKSEHHRQRMAGAKKTACDWFTIKEAGTYPQDVMVRGVWTEQLDARKMGVELNRTLAFPEVPGVSTSATIDPSEIVATPLLLIDDHVLVAELRRPTWQGSHIFVLHNGSWLLNLPLIQHEHRKLAGRLIDECGEPAKALFLETTAGGPRVSDQVENAHHVWKAFTVWPLNCILLHVTVLGILACFAAFPIFGRARTHQASSPTDFGKHVYALGKLYSQTHDAAYARDRLVYYRDKIRSEPTPLSSREKLAGESGNPTETRKEVESSPFVKGAGKKAARRS